MNNNNIQKEIKFNDNDRYLLDHRFELGVQLFKMMSNCTKLRESVFDLMFKVINMIYSEKFNPLTVRFIALSPAGEVNKIFIVLESAEYLKDNKPINIPNILPSDPSYKLTSYIDSLYKVISGYNGQVVEFLHVCPGLCDLIFSTAYHIYEYYFRKKQKDFKHKIDWLIGDYWQSGDLIIYGSFK